MRAQFIDEKIKNTPTIKCIVMNEVNKNILKTKKDFPPGEHLLYMNYVLSTEPYNMGSGEKISQLLSEPLEIIARLMPGQ